MGENGTPTHMHAFFCTDLREILIKPGNLHTWSPNLYLIQIPMYKVEKTLRWSQGRALRICLTLVIGLKADGGTDGIKTA